MQVPWIDLMDFFASPTSTSSLSKRNAFKLTVQNDVSKKGRGQDTGKPTKILKALNHSLSASNEGEGPMTPNAVAETKLNPGKEDTSVNSTASNSTYVLKDECELINPLSVLPASTEPKDGNKESFASVGMTPRRYSFISR